MESLKMCDAMFPLLNWDGINYFCRAKVVDENNGGSGWVFMRQSVHYPDIAINMQSSVVGGCHAIGEILLQR